MKIGCVKEIKNNEYRVGLTPDNVRAYIAAGHHVYIEKGAGIDVRYKTNNGWYKTINGNYVLASLTVKTKPA